MSKNTSVPARHTAAGVLVALLVLPLQPTADAAMVGGYLFDGTVGPAGGSVVPDLGGDNSLDLFAAGPSNFDADTPFTYVGNTSFDVSDNVIPPSNARANNDAVTAYEFQNTDTWTVSMWINTSVGGAFQQVVGQRKQVTGNGWYAGLDSSNHAVFFVQGTTVPQGRGAGGTSILTDGQWHHIVTIHDPAADADGEIFLYVDGLLESNTHKTQTEPIDYYTGTDPTNDAEFSIGVGRDCCFYNPFTGLVDEVAVFDHAFSQAEVTNAFQNSLFAPGGPGLLLGDADNSDTVTADDLIAVQQSFGAVGPVGDGTDPGDANDDGSVTADDLITIQQNFGCTPTTSGCTVDGNLITGPAGGVPEPATLAIICAAGASLLLRDRLSSPPGKRM